MKNSPDSPLLELLILEEKEREVTWLFWRNIPEYSSTGAQFRQRAERNVEMNKISPLM